MKETEAQQTTEENNIERHKMGGKMSVKTCTRTWTSILSKQTYETEDVTHMFTENMRKKTEVASVAHFQLLLPKRWKFS